MKTPRAHDLLSNHAEQVLLRLGKAVARARKLRRQTQADLAARAGTTAKTIGRLERGEPTVTLGTLAMVLDIFDLAAPLGELLDQDPLLEGAGEALGKRVRKARPDFDPDF